MQSLGGVGTGYSTSMAASSSPTSHDLLSVYLKDHLTAASAGVELFRRCARSHSNSASRARLAVLADQVAEDRDALVSIMRRLDVPVQPHRFAVGWVTEKAGRLKPNGSLWQRTRLTDLVEIESMSVGVAAKLSAWQNLEVTAGSDDRLGLGTLRELQERAGQQLEELKALRRSAAVNALDANS